MKALIAIAVTLLGVSSQAQQSKYITIGDNAPSLKTAKWVKGEAVPEFKKGRMYVVEFWATWCNPCREGIPHLTEMAKKYADKVSFVGVSVWESQDKTVDTSKKVAAFVKSMGSKMDYHVAADGNKNVIADAWMTRASEGGLPTSFIIDGNGKIAWIGGLPLLEETLEKIVSGKFDVAAAREQRELQVGVMRPIDEAIAKKDYKAAVKAIDHAVEVRPKLEYNLTYPLLLSLFHSDIPRAIEKCNKILVESDHTIGAYQMMSSIMATQTDLKPEAYKFGLEIIEEALLKKENEFMFRAMKAEVLFSTGNTLGAIESVKLAIDMADKEPHASDEIKKLMRTNLAKYTKGK